VYRFENISLLSLGRGGRCQPMPYGEKNMKRGTRKREKI
jgi:hypothetical protein